MPFGLYGMDKSTMLTYPTESTWYNKTNSLYLIFSFLLNEFSFKALTYC